MNHDPRSANRSIVNVGERDANRRFADQRSHHRHARVQSAARKRAFVRRASGACRSDRRDDGTADEDGRSHPFWPVKVMNAIHTPSATTTVESPIVTTLPSALFTRSPRIFLSFAMMSRNPSTIGKTNALNAST